MCLKCLTNELESIEDYNNRITEFLSEITCECCKSFPTFLIKINGTLKLLCLIKMKRHTEIMDSKKMMNLMRMEKGYKMEIDEKLEYAMEQLDDIKEDILDASYLNKANHLKSLKDMVKNLNDAEHR
jgi:hypothetical protein